MQDVTYTTVGLDKKSGKLKVVFHNPYEGGTDEELLVEVQRKEDGSFDIKAQTMVLDGNAKSISESMHNAWKASQPQDDVEGLFGTIEEELE